jgi:hypothetical protein
MRAPRLSVYRDAAHKEASMNTTDMYSREKASQAHLDDIRRETAAGRLLREARQSADPEPAAASRRRMLALAGAAAAALITALVIASALNIQSLL